MAKCQKKQLDAIVLNSLNDKGAGFGGDKNKITFIEKSGEKTAFGFKVFSCWLEIFLIR